MSYLKLCQLLNQDDTQIYYQEDCDGNVLVNNPSFPISIQCEIINWVSEEEFKKRGRTIPPLESRIVLLETRPDNIRQTVYDTLLTEFPALII